MNKKVKVALPVNISREDAHLFEPFISYKFPFLPVRYLNKIFITATGLACNRIGILKDCTHRLDMGDNYDRMMNEMSRHYHAVNDNPQNLTIFDNDETYLLIHHPWQNNYYHWVCEGLLRLWLVKDKTEGFILLLFELYKELPFFLQSLEPFRFKDIYFIEKNKSILVRNLCMPKMKPQMEVYVPDALNEMREFYVDYVKNKKKINVDLGGKIYLSRSKSLRRKIQNEDAVTALLVKYGFKVFANEDYDFFEQVSLYSNSRYLITMHGAGMTNMLFMPAGSVVFELHKKQTNDTDHHSVVFWYMADGLKHKYYHQICEPVDPEGDFYYENMIVDTDRLEQNLKLIFS